MKRTPIQRKTPLRAKAPMKLRSRTKSTPARRSARDQDCTLRLPGCQNRRDTVVLCHLREFGGGGMGIKPNDLEAVYGCHHCHDIIDGRASLIPELRHELNWERIARALVETHRAMRANGIITIKGEAA